MTYHLCPGLASGRRQACHGVQAISSECGVHRRFRAGYSSDHKYPPAYSGRTDQLSLRLDAGQPLGNLRIHRNGCYNLYRQDIGSRTPQVLVATPWAEVLSQVSPDGRYLLYATAPDLIAPKYSLRRLRLAGGTPEKVPIGGSLEEFRCSLGQTGICVLRTTVKNDSFVYYRLDPERGKGEELARTINGLTDVRG